MLLSMQRALLLAFFFCLYLIYGSHIIQRGNPLYQHDDARCAAHPDTGGIVVAIKASAANTSRDDLNRIATIFQCLRSDRLLFFSDLEHSIGPYHLHDVLSDIRPDLLERHHDFTLYRQQKKMAKSGLSMRDIQQTPVLSESPLDFAEASKNLDKYKFMHMVERTWAMQPDRDWYIFTDPASYYVWPALVRYLKEQDPTTPRFLSQATRIGQSDLDIPNGETGFILSAAAIKALMDPRRSLNTVWDEKMPFMESGEHALATAVHAELNLTLTNAWPVMIGDPGEIPFQTNIWCEPVVAFSNVSSDLALRLLAREQKINYTSPREFLTYGDLFGELASTSPGQLRTLPNDTLTYTWAENWDNAASVWDKEWFIDWRDPKTQDKGLIAEMLSDPNRSPDDCARACDAFRDCMQFSHMAFNSTYVINGKSITNGGMCYLNRLYQFGAYKGFNEWEDDGSDAANAPNSVLNAQVWVSGWITYRWDSFSAGLTSSCSLTM